MLIQRVVARCLNFLTKFFQLCKNRFRLSVHLFFIRRMDKRNGKHVSTLKDVLYEVRCLKSNEDMILALTGQFKQWSHEPEKFRETIA